VRGPRIEMRSSSSGQNGRRPGAGERAMSCDPRVLMRRSDVADGSLVTVRRPRSESESPMRPRVDDTARSRALERIVAHRRIHEQDEEARQLAESRRKEKYASFDLDAMRALAEGRAVAADQRQRQNDAKVSNSVENTRRDDAERRVNDAVDKEQRRAEIYALNALMSGQDKARWNKYIELNRC
jgi:hypothetical protein